MRVAWGIGQTLTMVAVGRLSPERPQFPLPCMRRSEKCRTLKSDDQSSFWGFESAPETLEPSYVLKSGSLQRLYSTFAGGWPGAGLLLMRMVVGSALPVRAGLRLWRDLPAMNVTIHALVLTGVGILLIVG
jgi:hypothetical protein